LAFGPVRASASTATEEELAKVIDALLEIVG